MQEINFQKLIENYDQNLLDNLRGFGKEDEYLKFWVPGTNEYQSFLNLIDALIETKLLKFKIIIDLSSDQNKLLDEIEKFLNNISKFEKTTEENYVNFIIEVQKPKYEKFLFNKKNLNKNIEFQNIDKTKRVSISEQNTKIKPYYKKKLDLISTKEFFSDISFKGEKNYYFQKINNIEIALCIKNQIIENLSHNINEENDLKKLFNVFFEIILKKNIQEAADHGVIYLEEKIRGYDKKNFSKGIILPDQAGSYFTLINKFIRKIFLNYENENNTKFDVNKNYYKVSIDWEKLSYDKKLKRINLVLDEFYKDFSNLSKESLSINKIENNFKIYLNVDKDFTKIQEKTNLLLNLEIKLKKIDNTLEVFVDEILDKNKLRLKNSPQKIN